MTTLATVTAGEGADTVVNQNTDAMSPAGLYGRRAPSTSGLTWGYYGGRGFGNTIADGTVTLTASTTNYVVASRSTGAVSVSTSISNWNDTTNYFRLYLIVTGTAAVTSYTDYREFVGGGGGGGGSLTNWTEAANSAAPNATIPVVSFAPANAATNVDAALVAKGTGGTLAQIPDNATAGGNKRGILATDWQKLRSAAAMVASGLYSVLIGGRDNTASGDYSIAGGFSNNVSGQGAVALGQSNTVAGSSAAAVGNSNTASGNNSFSAGTASIASGVSSVAMGDASTADGANSIAMGNGAAARAVAGARAFSSGRFSVNGDAQTRTLVLRRSTSDATPSAATTTNAAASTTNQATLPSGSAMKFRFDGCARQNATGDTAYFSGYGAIKNVGGTVSLVGTPTVTQDFADAGAAAWAVAATADNTNKAVLLTVTGEAAKTIKWVFNIVTTECV